MESTENPLTLTVDASKLVTAEFKAKPVAFGQVASGIGGVSLAWNNLGWALTYRLLRGTTGDAASAVLRLKS